MLVFREMYTKIHKNAATLSSLTSMFWDGKADVGQLNMVEPLTTFVLEKDDTSST